MQMMTAMQREEEGPKKRTALADRRHFTHKRLERWIRLQQFVYGLPDDYSYAVCLTSRGPESHQSRSLVKVGWMCWFGEGLGADKQHSLAVSLLNTGDALSANSTNVILYRLRRAWRAVGGLFRRKETKGRMALAAESEQELLAG